MSLPCSSSRITPSLGLLAACTSFPTMKCSIVSHCSVAYWSRNAISTLFLSSVSHGKPNDSWFPLRLIRTLLIEQILDNWTHPPVRAILNCSRNVGSRVICPPRSTSRWSCRSLASASSFTLHKLPSRSEVLMRYQDHHQYLLLSCRAQMSKSSNVIGFGLYSIAMTNVLAKDESPSVKDRV